MSPSLAIDLERRYPRGPAVAARLDLPLDAAPVTVLFGASGSGKTTILRCLAGLDRPQRGSIRLGGETWFDAAAGVHVPPQRRRVGLLFQDHALFPHLRVVDNVAFGLAGLPRARRDEALEGAVRLLRLGPLLDRRPGELSGGERQRVALARALAPRPRLLLLDEPLSALDAPAREELRGELRSVLVSAGVPSLVVTHDRIEALALGDRIAVLAEGSVRQVGPVPEVFGAPADLAVARAVGMENVLPARVVERAAGLAVAEVGPVRLVAVDPGHLGSDAFACVRAEEIVLEPRSDAPTSARNRLPAVVRRLDREGPLVRVALDCGFPLVALVTRQAAVELALSPGAAVDALVKAPSIRLVARAA